MKIDVHTRAYKLILSPESAAEKIYLDWIARELGHGVGASDEQKAHKVMAHAPQQWGTTHIELPLIGASE